jgi:hypothetical protein
MCWVLWIASWCHWTFVADIQHLCWCDNQCHTFETPERKKKREGSPLIEEIEAAVPAVTPEPSKKKSKKEKSTATPTPTAVEVEEEATEEKVGINFHSLGMEVR